MNVVFQYAPKSDLMGLKVRGGSPVGGGKRGEIRGFSSNSRKRLLRKIATLKKDELPLFVTLTYGEEYPKQVEEST